MTRRRDHHTGPGDDPLLYSRYPALRALHPVHRRAPTRRPTPNERRPHHNDQRRV